MKEEHMRRKIQHEQFQLLVMCIPYILGLLTFQVYPFLKSIYLSFFDGTQNMRFVGLRNYVDLLCNKAFLIALKNSGLFYVISLPILVFVPLILAYLLRSNARLRALLERVAFLLFLIPSSAFSTFLEIFFSERGYFSKILSVNLYSSDYTFFLLVIFFVFKYSGVNFLIYVLAIERLPVEFFFEASINGATSIQTFRYVVFPATTRAVWITLAISLMNSHKIYREAFIIGGRYPHNSIYFLQHFIHNNLLNLRYNHLCAATTILVLGILLLTIIIFGVCKIWEKLRKIL